LRHKSVHSFSAFVPAESAPKSMPTCSPNKGPVSQLCDPREFDELLRLMRKFVAAVGGEQSSDA
jgi:hypothetical protein